jgi:putative transposase
MANTYTQIHIQLVFAVQNKGSLISPTWKEELHQYITGIIQKYGHKLLRINGMPDHIHILFGMRPTQALSELVQHVKQDPSKWINEKRLVQGKFSWQSGFGAFSYSPSDVPNVIAYNRDQEKHHKVRTFQEEYLEMLKAFEVEHDERYIFKPVE